MGLDFHTARDKPHIRLLEPTVQFPRREIYFMKLLSLLLTVVFLTASAAAQHGSASSGYFPLGYAGDTWSGTVSAIDPDSREITLTYQGKGKEETFTGVLTPGYTRKGKDGKPIEVKMTDIPVGTYVVAYYMVKTRKVDGQKIKYNEIFDFQLYASAPKK